MRNAGLEEAQAGIKIARRNINNLIYADDTTLMAESEGELQSLLMKVKEESEKIVRSESETERKPEVPASPRGEALFRCARPSGVPRGPATSTVFPMK